MENKFFNKIIDKNSLNAFLKNESNENLSIVPLKNLFSIESLEI